MWNFKHRDEGWTPYFYLAYTIFLFFPLVLGRGDRTQWLVTLSSFAVFLVCYFCIFWRRRPGPALYLIIMILLGVVSLPFNPGASSYFIYAGTFIALVLRPSVAPVSLAAVTAVFAIEYWWLGFPVWQGVMMLVIMLAVSLASFHYSAEARSNSRLKLAHDELEHLAKVAERERIARDLHDVLGHTLSVVVLKSELAAKLLDRDLERARNEILQVEQIARQALSEVRQAISGYRAVSMAEELARARETLETAGVTAECSISDAHGRKLSAAQEALLTLVVREAVTNVIRHASARKCRLALEEAGNGWRLSVEDDGRGGIIREGNGLRGMRERVEGSGGSMHYDTTSGTKLHIFIPRKSPHEAVA